MSSSDPGTDSGAPPRPTQRSGVGPGPRQLRRRPDEGHIAGVCSGVAHYFNIDPVIVRIAAVVLLFTGPGAVAYILAWIFVPEEPSGPSHPFTGGTRHDRGAQVFGIVLLAVAVSVLWGGWWSPARRWILPIGLMALGVWLLFRRNDDSTTDGDAAAPGNTGTAPAAAWTRPSDPAVWLPGGDPSSEAGSHADEAGEHTQGEAPGDEPGDATDTWGWAAHLGHGWGGHGGGSGGGRHGGGHPPWGPGSEIPAEVWAARRRRRMVFPMVLGGLLVWAGIAFLLGVSLESGLAGALCIVGLGFVLGAFVGGSKILIVPAVLLGAALATASVVDIPLSGPIGQRTWTPTEVSEVADRYEVSMGEGILDLTDLELDEGSDLEVEATVGLGHLLVEVPSDVEVIVDGDAGVGGVLIDGREDNGVSVSTRRSLRPAEPFATITLDLQVGMGQVEVVVRHSGPRPRSEPESSTSDSTTSTSVPR